MDTLLIVPADSSFLCGLCGSVMVRARTPINIRCVNTRCAWNAIEVQNPSVVRVKVVDSDGGGG